MPRSVTARLELLEAKSQQRRSAIEAAKEAQIDAALEGLSDEDLKTLEESYTAIEERPAWYEEVSQTMQAVSVPLEGGEAARAWSAQLDALPEGTARPLPPLEAPAYFEAEAQDWQRALKEWEAGQNLPDGVRLEVLQTCARWGAVQTRLYALMASVLLED